MLYSILQLKSDAKDFNRKMFVNYKDTVEEFGKVDLSDYEVVYEGDLKWTKGTVDELSVREALEDIYAMFNVSHPEGFKGHSMSMSDIVYINDDYYYCDDFGFEKINF